MSAKNLKKTANPRPSRRGWLFALGFALLLQSLFPSGYMPASISDGWIAALCPEGLPDGFVQQTAGAGSNGSQSIHHASHGGSDSDTGMLMASCEMGSALDQSIAVDDTALDAAPVPDITNRVPPEGLRFFNRSLHSAQPRAPPVS